MKFPEGASVVVGLLGALMSLLAAVYSRLAKKRDDKDRKLTVHTREGESIDITGQDADEVEKFLKQREKGHTAAR
jgi:hypothetical protein